MWYVLYHSINGECMRNVWPAIMIVFSIIFFTNLSTVMASDEPCRGDGISHNSSEITCCCTDQMMIHMQEELKKNDTVKECCDHSMACSSGQPADSVFALSVVQIDFSQSYLYGSFHLCGQEPKRGQGWYSMSTPRAPPVPVYITHCSFLI
jgi:hypothetical protein